MANDFLKCVKHTTNINPNLSFSSSYPSNLNFNSSTNNEYKQHSSSIRKHNHIHIHGFDPTDPQESFQAFNIPSYIHKNITQCGWKVPTPVQMQVIPLLLDRREVFAMAPTGSGKTASYIIPILSILKKPGRFQQKVGSQSNGLRALVIAPTRELASQIYRHFLNLSYGKKWKISYLRKSNASSNCFSSDNLVIYHDILVATPLRLIKLIDQQIIDLSSVELLILDEADILFSNKFIDQTDRILSACTHSSIVRAFFSATLPNSIEEIGNNIMRDPVKVTVGQVNTTTKNVKQHLIYVGNEDGKVLTLRQLLTGGLSPPIMIFVQDIERAGQLFNELKFHPSYTVDAFHSHRSQRQRDLLIQQFRSGELFVLISTDLLSRGMDIKGVRTIINFDFPQNISSYIHRIGRTGRMGQHGSAYTFFTEDDRIYLRSIAHVMKQSGCDVEDWMLNMKKISRNQQKELKFRPIKRKALNQTKIKRKHSQISLDSFSPKNKKFKI